MPATWDEVASNPKFQALQSDQKVAASKQYFDTVVAPKVPKEHLEAAQQQFSDYAAKTMPRTFGESTSARAGEAMDEKPSGLASFVRTKVLGFDPLTPISKAFGVVASPLGAAGETVERKAGQMVGANPVKLEKAARDTGDVTAQLAGILPGGKIAKAGEEIATAGKELSTARHEKFVNDLISPAQTTKQLKTQVPRTKEVGWNEKKVVEQAPYEKEMAAEVKKLPVSRRKSLQGNYNVIQDAVEKENNRLITEVKKHDIPVSGQSMIGVRGEAIKNALKDPYVASHRTAAKTIVDQFTDIFQKMAEKNNGKVTLSDVLQARKNFDKAVIGLKKNAYTSDIKNSTSVMARELRNGLNEFIEKNLPSESAKASFKKQHLLIKAMDNIAPKAAKQPSTWTGRVVTHPVAQAVKPLVKPAVAGAGLGTAYHYLGGGQ